MELYEQKAKQILDKIDANKDTYLIFGISTCGYCKKTILYMNEHNLRYKYYDLDKYYEIFIMILNQIRKMRPSLNIKTDHQTFPIIFYNNKFVGGYNDLVNSMTNNKI